jgi:hypothetical protein
MKQEVQVRDAIADTELALLHALAPAFGRYGYRLVPWQHPDLHRHVWHGLVRGPEVWDYVFELGHGC